MLLTKEKLQHINSISHEGKVVVFATDTQGNIHYTIKQDGFEDSYLNTPADQRTGWEDWQELEFPNEAEDDESVVEKETEALTDQNDSSNFLMRSRYRTENESAVAPVQVVSGMGHIYVFRQSKADATETSPNTLLVDRFVLDGMTNQLVRKLDVRFKRSRQKYKPIESMKKKADGGLSNIDSLDFRDANGEQFYEPTTELSLINNLHQGWFSVVLVPTNEHEVYRWHIFAYNSQNQKVELTTIRASDEGLFDVQDYTVLEQKPEAKNALVPRSIPGIIQRTLNLNGVEVANGFSATKYDLQKEQQTKDGMQLLKDSSKIMLAIPTTQGNVAAISFAVAADGTLSQIDENPDSTNVIRSNNRDLLLPLNTLDEIKAIGDSTPPPQGKITAVTRGDEDTVQIISPETANLNSGDVIRIKDTQSYNGHYVATKLDADTFEIEASYVNGDIGNWEVIPESETGLIFDGAITAFERVADKKLKITAFNHGLENGDEVQIVDTNDLNETFGIQKIDEETFVVDGIHWVSGEAVNLKLESRKRRGVMFNGSDEYIAIPALELTPPSTEFAFGYTVSAWVYLSATGSGEQIIVGETDECLQLVINSTTVSLKVKFASGVQQVTDTATIPTGQWVHYAGVIASDGKSNKTTLTLAKNGLQVGTALEVTGLPQTVENWEPEFEIGKSFAGKIADVQVWDKVRTAKEIKDSMYLQLTGREVDLVGYWRLGAITEGKERKVVDFSVNGNDAIVYGDAFVSAITLNRTLGDNTTQVVKYTNDDLVAVSARATYIETFEFKTDTNVNPNNVNGNKLFKFSYWGKSSRSSNDVITFVGNDNDFVALGNNWYKATCRFTIPDGVAMMRTFELSDVKGTWATLEIRKHRVQLVSDSISQVNYTDSISLSTLADQYAQLPGQLTTLGQKEKEEAELLKEKRELEDQIAAINNLPLLQQQVAALQTEVSSLQQQEQNLKTKYEQEVANPLNYEFYFSVKVGSSSWKGVHVYEQSSGDGAELIRHRGNGNLFKFLRQGDSSLGYLQVKVGNSWKGVHVYQQSNGDGAKLTRHSGNGNLCELITVGNNYHVSVKVGNSSWKGVHVYQQSNSDEARLIRHRGNGNLFSLNKTSQTTNSRINNARTAWETKTTELSEKQSELTRLQDLLNASANEKSALEARLAEVIEELTQVQSELNTANNTVINTVSTTQQTPQTLSTLHTVSSGSQKGLVTKGGLLGFASPVSRITAIETCEGNVQLSYFDNQGRMRLTNYDATSDTQNTTFEQWLPDELPVGLNFADSNDKIELSNPIYLSEEWTIETWFCYPLPNLAQNQTKYVLIAENNGNLPIVVEERKYLGTVVEGSFYNSGYNLEQLSTGWHHLTAVGKEFTTIFYIDGKEVANVKQAVIDAETNENTKTQLEQENFKTAGYFSVIGNSTSGNQQFGKISELRIWNLALSKEEIAVNSKTRLSGNEPGLVTYYSLNEATGTEVRDLTGSGNNGTVAGATWWGCTAPIGNLGHQVMEFDGKDDYIKITNTNSFNSSAITVESWIKLERKASSDQVIFSQAYNCLLNVFGPERDTPGLVEFGGTNLSPKWRNGARVVDDGQWHHVAATYDGARAKIYVDGELDIATNASGSLNLVNTPSIGALSNSLGSRNLNGQMAEVRIWNKARTQDEIKADMHQRLTGEEDNLVGYWPLNNIQPEGDAIKVLDLSSNNHHGTVNGAIIKDSNTLPIGSNALVSAEYSTVGIDKVTSKKTSIMRRFLASPALNGVELLPDKRIEELELKWIGNAQFAPTLLGYIEGAPPIPSENLTVQGNYNGATSVELNTSEDVEFSWYRAQDVGLGASLDAFLGGAGEVSGGIGVESQIAKWKAGFKGNLDLSYQWQNESNISSSSSLSMTDRLELRGTQEQDTKFSHLGKRFIPKNVGYALVISGLADVFITRLKRSQKMVGYQVRPVDGIPPDVNTITFLINPAYTMSGSLDGMTGSSATSDRFFRHVPEMRSQYGSLYPASYYRLQEAYDLKQQIENDDKRRASYFAQFNAGLVDESSLNREIESGEAPTEIGVTREEDKPDENLSAEEQQAAQETQQQQIEQEAGAAADKQSEAAKQKQKEIDSKISDQEKQAHATDSFAGWQKRMENIQIRAGKRNIVNTYVWDADGGLRTEAQSFANTAEHTVGGSFTLDAGLGFQGDFTAGVAGELTALVTVNLTQTMSKTESRSKGLELNVDLSGVESTGITDYNDYPIQPGEKVDRYRFMSFYLEGTTKNFNDFFSYVVDPEWLASNDEEARALRQAKGKANKTWRVLHRVTYVERPALMGFGRDTRQIENGDRATEEILDYFNELDFKNQELKAEIEQIKLSNQELSTKLDQVLNAIGNSQQTTLSSN